jgi:hypothetical protein
MNSGHEALGVDAGVVTLSLEEPLNPDSDRQSRPNGNSTRGLSLAMAVATL